MKIHRIRKGMEVEWNLSWFEQDEEEDEIVDDKAMRLAVEMREEVKLIENRCSTKHVQGGNVSRMGLNSQVGINIVFSQDYHHHHHHHLSILTREEWK